MLVFHRGLMKYILSDRGNCRGVSAMRGDSGWLPGHTGGGIPVGEPSGAHGDTGWCSQNQGYCYHRALL